MNPPGSLTVHAPLPGKLVQLAEVPDPVFAQGMVGHGAALEPVASEDFVTVVAPVSGRMLKVMPHAFVVQAPSGQGVLVHLGIDTVKLEGDGFTVHVAKGDQVSAGDPLVDMDLTTVRAAGLSACCPVIVLDSAADAITPLTAAEDITAGQDLFAVFQ
ncbi:PTS sugar transporter subunit IIA [Kocuria tytonis]|uniref:PTS sugar transporter subunit IIA n=1 Tax=Kocuria tytonis TaxID=2054280 RepID=UPI0018F5BE30|nr:PTS glucose transporter subunit IIA [Kocuria tytonis]